MIEDLKHEVLVSSQNVVSAARTTLINHPNIDRVILLDRTPRFDLPCADPTGIKSYLSEYGNRVMRDQVENSDLKNKIVIGAHNLPRKLHQNIYGDPAVHGYDGVHLYGPDGKKLYTNSLCNILQSTITKNSRESHNHLPLKAPPVESARSSYHHPSPPSGSSSPPTSKDFYRTHFSPFRPSEGNPATYTKPAKPDTVVLDIDPPIFSSQVPSYSFSYTTPVNNFFETLGN